MFRRALSARLASSLEQFPVVTLLGPRQSGKTTLVRETFSDFEYLSLERPDQRARASADPLSVMGGAGRRLILDEVQRLPELLSYIQVAVDEEPSSRFVLTGSQNLLLMESVSQSLAGRTDLLQLMPLSVAERFGHDLLPLSELLEADAVGPAPATDLWSLVWSGLYPRIHDQSLDPQRWLAAYVRTYVERDLRDVLRVLDLTRFETFLRLAAARTGQELNLSELASDAGVTQPTAKQWLTALEIGFLVTRLEPHHKNYRKRLRKRPKLHFLDTGIACYLLGIQSPETLKYHPLRGAIFESFVVSELLKASYHHGQEPALSHWRDAGGHEVDVIAQVGSRLYPIETKSSSTVPADAFDSLEKWLRLAGDDAGPGTLVHGGEQAYSARGVRVRPWYWV